MKKSGVFFVGTGVLAVLLVLNSAVLAGNTIYDCNLTVSDSNALNNPQIVRVTLSITTLGGRIIFVDANTPDNNDGSSWNHALKYFQDALETAGSGSIICVANGTYHPDSNSANPSGSGDRTAAFQLINNVEIYGGYAGYGEPDPNLRDVELYETILGGDLDDNDGEVSETEDLLNDPNRAENSYHVVTGSGTDLTAVLDGFTIRGGNADGVDPINDKGGGVYNDGGNPTIRNCTFMNNSARGQDGNGSDRIDGDPGYGGGFYNNGGSLTLTGCTFAGNAVRGGDNSPSEGYGGHSYGGGMYSKNANLVLVDCTFSNNLALGGNGNNFNFHNGNGYGSGLYYPDGTITLTNSTFTSNLARGGKGASGSGDAFGAGLFSSSPASGSTITDCTFGNNISHRGSGGGIYLNSSSPIISNCYFLDNTGGGICCNASNPAINDCTFSGNSSYFSSGKGGGICNVSYSCPTLNRCKFIGNSAGYGGGMSNDFSYPNVNNCAFTGNSATFESGGGGGMYNYNCSSKPVIIKDCEFSENSSAYVGGGIYHYYDARATLTNCIFGGNSSNSTGGGVSCSVGSMTLTNCTFANNSASNGRALASDGNFSPTASSNLKLSNCILWDGGSEIWADLYAWIAIMNSDIDGGWAGSGNINADPLFVSGPLGDYYLSQVAAGQASNSPCVDAGSDAAANLGMDIFTTRTDHITDSGVVDMGYHYPVVIRSADIVKNWYVDFMDYAVLAGEWLQWGEPESLAGDIFVDGRVDIDDLDVLADAWLDCYVKAADDPSPSHTAGSVDPNTTLAWSAGEGALYHDVYLGTDANAVAAADYLSPEFKGTVSVPNFDPCGLEQATLYYWRVDEVGPACTKKGDVWSFRTWLAPNFISWWKFDEGQGEIAYDSAGNNDGTIYGAAWTTGKIGDYALDFDGLNDYVGAGIGTTAGPVTYAFWFNTDQISVTKRIVTRDWTNGGSFTSAHIGGELRVISKLANGASGPNLNGGPILPNAWYHAAYLFDGANVALYVNGILKDIQSQASIRTDSNIIRIGAELDGGNNFYFNGIIDDVRLYNRALTGPEVQQLYQEGQN